MMDHDSLFRLSYIPIEAYFRYMVRLHKERVMARLARTTFDYPLHPYTMRLTYYFVRASTLPLDSEMMTGGLNAD